MLKPLCQALGVTGVAYAVLDTVYGGAQFINVGYGIVPAWQVLWGVSGMLGVLVPSVSPLMELYRKLFPKKNSNEYVVKVLHNLMDKAVISEDDELFEACELVLDQLEDK